MTIRPFLPLLMLVISLPSFGFAQSITATDGTPQSAIVDNAFTTNLEATVLDALSNPVIGASVIFTAPSSGASGTFSGSGANADTVLTNSSGVATASVFTANTIAGGAYTVTAVEATAGTANFSLTNDTDSPSSITASAGTPQSTTVNTAFGFNLAATVTDQFSNLINGASVTFMAPSSGESGTFAGSGTDTETVLTNSSGVAIASVFTANITAGSYTVTANEATAGSANFSLTNDTDSAFSITASAGTSQSTTVNTAFGTNLAATVTDQFSNLINGASVIFTAPSSDASGTFFGTGTNTETVLTNSSGVATASVFTANTIAGGPY
ncbi:hypothetical protein IIA28_20705, partial [candidate division KSB1 bacterium]|nr:hypothetical protein [candidate division KSB1 bacterium]